MCGRFFSNARLLLQIMKLWTFQVPPIFSDDMFYFKYHAFPEFQLPPIFFKCPVSLKYKIFRNFGLPRNFSNVQFFSNIMISGISGHRCIFQMSRCFQLEFPNERSKFKKNGTSENSVVVGISGRAFEFPVERSKFKNTGHPKNEVTPAKII